MPTPLLGGVRKGLSPILADRSPLSSVTGDPTGIQSSHLCPEVMLSQTCTGIFIVALYIPKNCKPDVLQQMVKLWYIHTIPLINKYRVCNNVDRSSRTMLSERPSLQKCVIPLIIILSNIRDK